MKAIPGPSGGGENANAIDSKTPLDRPVDPARLFGKK
jgi:hypothetical protein